MKKTIRKLGVFDSGVGGLTVLKELQHLPVEEFVYVADTANLPYGEKTPEQIKTFTSNVVAFLNSHHVDAVVIACHTASAVALDHVSAQFPHLTIIGVVDPVAQAALATTRNDIIGVIGTPATIASRVHEKKIKAQRSSARVVAQACQRFVPLIESGLRNKQELLNAFQEYLTPLQQAGCDTLIIGCTHYELILKEIDIFLRRKITLISAPLKTMQAVLPLCDRTQPANKKTTYYVTGTVEQFRNNAQVLMGLKLDRVEHVQLPMSAQARDFSSAERQDV